MKIAVISFTGRGHETGARIAACFSGDTVTHYGRAEGLTPYASLDAFARQAMAECGCIVFVGATGIAVRAVAPYLRGKDVDPAVLTVDENARFVIALLSGHIGGANRLAERLAQYLDAQPVVTTATDGRGLFAADAWAAEHGCIVADKREIKYISSALLRGEAVGFVSSFPVDGELPEGLRRGTGMEHGIALTLDGGVQPFAHTLRLIPRIVHVGVGCRRGAKPDDLRRAVMDSLNRLDISPRAVCAVASIDLKREEPAVLRLAEQLGCETRFYTSDELNAADGRFPESGFVHSVTGTDNVCQRAAARSAGADGVCLLPKTVLYGTTVSIYQEKWRAEF